MLTLDKPNTYLLPIGFASFPVIIIYGGFLHIWKIPFLSTLLAIAAGVYGTKAIHDTWKWLSEKRNRDRWWLCIVPGLILTILLFTKSSYLLAGHSAGDEGGRVMFTSAFANNHLKPAYPFDFSLPLAYPYNFFETSAFLYHAAHGFLFPTTSLFATTLVAIALFFYILYLTSKLVFTESADKKFVLMTVILTCSGIWGLKEKFGFLPSVRSPLQPISEFFHSGYHYLFGAALGIWGLALIARYFRENDRNVWYMAVLFLFLSFTFSGITAAWAGFGAVVYVLHNFVDDRSKFLPLMRLAPLSVLIGIIVLLPHIFSFLPRFDSAFHFSLPHFWFERNAQIFANNIHPSFALFGLFLLAPLSMIFTIGIFTFTGFSTALLAVTGWFTQKEQWKRLQPLSIGIAVSFFLLTFTTTVKMDWYSRGFIVPTILSAFIAAQVFYPLLLKKRAFAFLAVLLLLPQAISIVIEHDRIPKIPPNYAMIYEINKQYPLGTIFYEQHDFQNIYDLRKLVYMDEVFFAGRGYFSPPPEQYLSYLLHPDILAKLGIKKAFAPCHRTFYGTNVPSGHYIAIELNEENVAWSKKKCDP